MNSVVVAFLGSEVLVRLFVVAVAVNCDFIIGLGRIGFFRAFMNSLAVVFLRAGSL